MEELAFVIKGTEGSYTRRTFGISNDPLEWDRMFLLGFG